MLTEFAGKFCRVEAKFYFLSVAIRLIKQNKYACFLVLCKTEWLQDTVETALFLWQLFHQICICDLNYPLARNQVHLNLDISDTHVGLKKP